MLCEELGVELVEGRARAWIVGVKRELMANSLEALARPSELLSKIRWRPLQPLEELRRS